MGTVTNDVLSAEAQQAAGQGKRFTPDRIAALLEVCGPRSPVMGPSVFGEGTAGCVWAAGPSAHVAWVDSFRKDPVGRG
jgi:hypothetical protein